MNRTFVWTALGVLGLFFGYMFWHWEIERVEVPPDHFLVLVKRWGRPLPEDQLIATGPDAMSYQGVMLDTLGEGRHFLNPFFWSYQIHEYVVVPPGECLVLTRRFGKPISQQRLRDGEIVAQEGERGLIAETVRPGKHPINPFAYDFQRVPAVTVDIDEVGVRTLKTGKLPPVNVSTSLDQAAAESVTNVSDQYVVDKGYRGVQREVLGPGTYYINPFIESITPVEVRSHRVELHDLSFPSRDGFTLHPEVVVEYSVIPESASELLIRLTDEGKLHQDDETAEQQEKNAILQKVILPHIRGYARIEGSNFEARQFVLTDDAKHLAASGNSPLAAEGDGTKEPASLQPNPREQFQAAIAKAVKSGAKELGIDIRAVTLGDLHLPDELVKQISERELARVELNKNLAQVGQYKAQQELAAKQALTEQAKAKVEAETRLLQAVAKGKQTTEVEELRLTQELANAQIRLDAAKRQAEATLSKGKAEAAVAQSENEAEVAGLRQAVQGFAGVQNFAQYHVVTKLGPALGEVFASDDSEFAKLVSGYLAPREGNDAEPSTVPATASNSP